MKKNVFIIIMLFVLQSLFAENLHFENYIVKEDSNKFRTDTYYLGQIKSKSMIETLKNNNSYEYLDNYGGYSNVLKISNNDIVLYFRESELFSLIEIRLLTSKYYLNGTSIKTETSINDVIAKYNTSFTKYENEKTYYFAELEDYTSEFADTSFFNISLCVDNEIIKEIVLYYSFTL